MDNVQAFYHDMTKDECFHHMLIALHDYDFFSIIQESISISDMDSYAELTVLNSVIERAVEIRKREELEAQETTDVSK